jgi:multisubunit Na+/H+ antiporter MnhB subunit
MKTMAGLLTLGLGGVLVLAVLELPGRPGGLTAAVEGEIPRSGVGNPVTAVLLNFRAYDTWLEVGVLLLAVIGLLAVQRTEDLSAAPAPPPPEIVLVWMARVLVPVTVLVGGYLLWLGTHAPGGAFQAGAVLGAAGVLLTLAGYRPGTVLRGRMFRAAAMAGFAAFLVFGAAVLGTGRALLEYPAALAGWLILAIEAAAAVSIALALAALFAGARPITRL